MSPAATLPEAVFSKQGEANVQAVPLPVGLA